MALAELSVLLLLVGGRTVFGRECILDSDCEQSQQFGRIQAIQVHMMSFYFSVCVFHKSFEST